MDAHECSTMPGDSEAGRVVFSLVRGAKSDDYPDGNASEAWKRLGNRFEPKTAPSRLLLRRELLKLKQKHNKTLKLLSPKLKTRCCSIRMQEAIGMRRQPWNTSVAT